MLRSLPRLARPAPASAAPFVSRTGLSRSHGPPPPSRLPPPPSRRDPPPTLQPAPPPTPASPPPPEPDFPPLPCPPRRCPSPSDARPLRAALVLLAGLRPAPDPKSRLPEEPRFSTPTAPLARTRNHLGRAGGRSGPARVPHHPRRCCAPVAARSRRYPHPARPARLSGHLGVEGVGECGLHRESQSQVCWAPSGRHWLLETGNPSKAQGCGRRRGRPSVRPGFGRMRGKGFFLRSCRHTPLPPLLT